MTLLSFKTLLSPKTALCVLLLAVAIVNVSASDDDHTDGGRVVAASDESCPAWLREYEAWHAANRGQPNATYLVQYCPDEHVLCLGIGDRMKGIMVLLRVAHLYKKVLLLVWDHPEPISKYLHPNRIDWTLDGLPEDVVRTVYSKTDATPFDAHLSKNRGALLQLIDKGARAAEFKRLKVIRPQSNLWYGMTMQGSDDDVFIRKAGRNQFGRCLFKFLFKLSPQLEQDALDKLRELYGRDPRPYTAWHWRLGGMVSEGVLHRSKRHPGKKELDYSKLRVMMSVLPCADKLTQEHGGQPFDDQPLLLVTDHNLLRDWTARRQFRQMTAVPAKVVHMNVIDADSYHDTWRDLALLSMADCLVLSFSGYSNVALWMGSTDCTVHHLTCVAAQNSLFKRTPV